jgi:hypothetical protein
MANTFKYKQNAKYSYWYKGGSSLLVEGGGIIG